jgi:hypothetical protein
MKLHKNLKLILVFSLIACLQIGLSIYREKKELGIIKREEAKKQRFDDNDFKLAETSLESLVEPIAKVNEPKPLKLIEEGFLEDWMWFKGNSLYFYYDMDGDISNISLDKINSISADLANFYSSTGSSNDLNGIDIKINDKSIGLDFNIGFGDQINRKHLDEVRRFVNEASAYIKYKNSLSY